MRHNLQEIKAIPIPAYLERKGVQMPARGNICAFWRGDKNPSVSIDRNRNTWYDHGTGEYGSIIDLAMKIENCSFTEAIVLLESGSYGVASFPVIQQSQDREPAVIIDDVHFIQHPALIRYLNERGISTQIARLFCREVYYHLSGRPDSHYFAVGFQNRSGGWELRSSFAKIASSKDYTFISNGGCHLAIFEGFFDMLAYLEAPDKVFSKRAAENLLVLNSVGLVRKFIADLKAGKLDVVSTACLYLDADEAGRAASAKIKEVFSALGIRVLEDVGETLEMHWPGCTDINDCLLAYQQQTRDWK